MLPEKVVSQVSTCDDLVQCAYNLNDFEVNVYNMLAETGPLRADELADRMGRDRSTVYRALQKMLSCGMVFRETRNIPRGGYFHVYRAISKDELRGKLQDCVDDWYDRMKAVLDRFDEEHRS